MDTRPIGIMDSGFGGLTAVREILRSYPQESILFFGDNGRAPYGVHTQEEVAVMTQQDLDFLITKNVKAIIIACGTATSSMPLLTHKYPVPVVGVIDCSVQVAADATKNKKIGVIGTPLTIQVGKYANALKQIMPDCQIFSVACPKLVLLVEAGKTDPQSHEVKHVVEEYLRPIREAGVDTLILGCTHFPVLSSAIKAYMGDGVTLINAGRQAALCTMEQLAATDAIHDGTGRTLRFLTSGNAADFVRIGSNLVGYPLDGLVEHASAEEF